MIQNGTFLRVIDNSGSRIAACFKIIKGKKKRYAKMGDLILVSIKKLRSKRRLTSKTKKGEIYTALIVRTNSIKKHFCGNDVNFFENSIILINKKNKFVGTRIFGSVPKFFRFTKFLKIISISSGICN